MSRVGPVDTASPVPVHDHRTLVAAAPGAAWVRWALDPAAFPPAWRHPQEPAVAVIRPRSAYPSSLTVVGPPQAAGELADALLGGTGAPGAIDGAQGEGQGEGLGEGLGVASVTLPRATAVGGFAALRGAGPGVGWDWMWTDRAPADVPAEASVQDLDVTDPAVAAEVLRLLQAENPRHSAEPGDGPGTRWVGVRAGAAQGGALLACGAAGRGRSAVPLLASIAVAHGARGRGLGAAVTAALTRRAFADGAPVVAVDLYADNPAARRLYTRLGFVVDQEFTSRRL